MRYLSTRGGEAVSPEQAIIRGICPSGGLYVPESFPKANIESICESGASYPALAARILSLYLGKSWEEALPGMTAEAYARFDTSAVTPLERLSAEESMLELWHGPTMAFKDVALQMLPRLLSTSVRHTGETHGIYILVATSGDTGKAALAGFCDVPGTRILVFYPYGGVSEAQRLQMVTQEGANVDVCAVRGNFDDAQTGVKQIFASESACSELERLGYRLSSANSINFGRLLPQIVYYFASYAALVHSGTIACGEAVNFCVPTGNFGDILAGEYARRMGLPVHKLICASNRNNVLTDFFRTGVYDANRTFYSSMSCSIDILISSNLERLLFELSDRSCAQVEEWMRQLRETGRYRVGETAADMLRARFDAGWCGEEDTLKTIRRTFERCGRLIDPHTAVAQSVYEAYRARTGDQTHTVVLSTANPYKFATHVLGAFEAAGTDDFENAARLHALSGMPIPEALSALSGKPELHTDVCALSEMQNRVVSGVEAWKN